MLSQLSKAYSGDLGAEDTEGENKGGITEASWIRMCAFSIPLATSPPPGNPASRTGSRMAHITVKAEMQFSLHESPLKNNEAFIMRPLFMSRKISILPGAFSAPLRLCDMPPAEIGLLLA